MEIRAWNSRDELIVEGHDGEMHMVCIDESDQFSFQGGLLVYESVYDEDGYIEFGETGKLVAIVYGRFYDNTTIINEGYSLGNMEEDFGYNARLFSCADMVDEDNANAIMALLKSEMLEREMDEDMMCRDLYDFYLERLYIEPEFRGKGVAKFILDNLPALLHRFFNITLRCVVTYPRPLKHTDGAGIMSGWEKSDSDGEMKNHMIKVIEKRGFEDIGEGYFARKYIEV